MKMDESNGPLLAADQPNLPLHFEILTRKCLCSSSRNLSIKQPTRILFTNQKTTNILSNFTNRIWQRWKQNKPKRRTITKQILILKGKNVSHYNSEILIYVFFFCMYLYIFCMCYICMSTKLLYIVYSSSRRFLLFLTSMVS